MPLAAPVLHDEAEVVGVEEETLRVARSRRPQVDEKDDRKLEALRGVDREQRHGFRGRFFRRLAHRQLSIDDLVEVAHEVPDSSQREVSLEPSRELKDLAQVEEGARAAVTLRAQL